MKLPPRSVLALALIALPGARADSPTVSRPELKADDGKGLLSLGSSLSAKGDFASAEVAYRQIVDRSGYPVDQQQEALIGLARTYRREGEPGKAAAILEKYVATFPTDERIPDVYLELGRTLRSMGANRLALNRFYSVINSTLKLPQKGFEHYQSLARTAEYEIAETYYEDGDYAKASAYFTKLQLLDLSTGDRARASFMAARSQVLGGDLEGGSKSLHGFLETWPGNENVPEARYLLATTLRKLGKAQDALAVVLDLLRDEKHAGSSDPQAWEYWQRRTGNLLANDFFQGGDMLSALTIYKTMLRLGADPDWKIPVQYQVALCDERLYDFKEASESYKAVSDAASLPGASPELKSLGQMAAWRQGHIDWLQSTQARIASIPDLAGKTSQQNLNPATSSPPRNAAQ